MNASRQSLSWRRVALPWLAIAVLGVLAAAPAVARSAPADEIPEEVPVDLQTKDGVLLKATFYPGTKGRESVPLVMLHSWRGSRDDFQRLAKTLQAEHGYAILAPDLRGHGDSVQRVGTRQELVADRLRPADFANMVDFDMEAVRKFLIEKNNAEELNIDRLGIIGAEMGAVVAINWAAFDWSQMPLGNTRQGQYVKALVLMSPEWTFKGLSIQNAVKHEALQREISVFWIAGGESAKAMRDVERLDALLSTHRADEGRKPQEQRTLFGFTCKTSLQGSKLLGENLGVEDLIVDFLKWRLVDPVYPWRSHGNPIK